MTNLSALAGLFFSALALTSASHGREFPELEGPYMGQSVPGSTAVVFAPDIVSTGDWEVEGVFAPGMREFYFTTKGGEYSVPTVVGLRQEGNIWTKYIEFQRNGEVSFSPDGQRMHMAEGFKDRVGDGWSDRKELGPMFQREDWGIMRLSASARGTYVFDDYKSGDVIRISPLVGSERPEPEEILPSRHPGREASSPESQTSFFSSFSSSTGTGDSSLILGSRCFIFPFVAVI